MTTPSGIRRRAHLALLTVRTIALFGRVELGLRTGDLPTLARRLGLQLGDASEPVARRPGAMTGRQVREALAAVTRVSRRWPAGDTCLRRCLVLGTLLAPVHPMLAIGVRRGDDGTIGAHSWLVVNGTSLDPMAAQYTSLS